MANYENAGAVADAVAGMEGAGVSAATVAAINELIKDLAPTESVANVVTQASGTLSAAEAAAITQPVVMVDQGQALNATFGANSDVSVLVLNNQGGEGSDIKFDSTEGVTVLLGGADGDKLQIEGGDNQIGFAGGSATIETGDGNDSIVLGGIDGQTSEVNVSTGAGNAQITLDTDISGIQATVDAGQGFDQLNINAGRDLFSFVFNAATRMFRMVSGRNRGIDTQADGDGYVDMKDVNIVGFGDEGSYDEITVLAQSEGQANVARIYALAMGREAIDNGTVDGLSFWFEDAANGLGGRTNNSAAELDHVYRSMLACDEFQNDIAGKSGDQIAGDLLGRLGINDFNGLTAADLGAQIDAGTLSAEDLVINLITNQSVDLTGLDGDNYVVLGY